MAELFHRFPSLENDRVMIRKMTQQDVEALFEISQNDNIYKYISPFLQGKSIGFLETAIQHFGGRDFEKKKMIIAGIYLKQAPERLVGLAEIFDYKKKINTVTIGYRINETYWNQGIATSVIHLMVSYLTEEIGIAYIQAFVMSENVYSVKALIKNGFVKKDGMVQQKNWGGYEEVDTELLLYQRDR